MDILKNIKEKLHTSITDASFEGANIVLYTDNERFFKEGESKIWRLKGTVQPVSPTDDLGLPAAVNLTIKYSFPYKEVLEELEERHGQNIPPYAMQELEKEKDEVKTILKSLAVEIPNN